MITILPSIASADQANLEDAVHQLRDHPFLHIDLEDGNFVPNITFGMKTIHALRHLSSANFDAHLMVTDPMRYIPELLSMNFRAIAFHWEVANYPMRMINAIRNGAARAGLALNPRTPVDHIIPYLPAVDYVLIMTAEPDGCGDLFQIPTLEKIRQLRAAAPNLAIVADGGISKDLLPTVQEVGASAAVIGRAVFSTADPQQAIHSFCSI